MPHRLLPACLLSLASLSFAACDPQAPAPSASPTAVARSPVATQVPGPAVPSGPAPTDAPSGIASLLQPGDVADAAPGDPEVLPEDPSPPFAANGGISAFAREWTGEGAIRTIADLRWQFPDADSARAFLQGDEGRLSETGAGLELVAGDEPLGPNSRLYRGTRQEGDVEAQIYNVLFTHGNFAAKVLVVGDATTTRATAAAIALQARERINNSLRGAAGEETVFPDADEIALLSHVPPEIRAGCGRPIAPELAGPEFAVDCRVREGADLVTYGQYADGATMDATFDATVEFFAVDEGGDCATDDRALHRYAINGVEVGRILCGTGGNGTAVIHWTDERLDIRGVAYRRDGDLRALYEFWSSGAGPFE